MRSPHNGCCYNFMCDRVGSYIKMQNKKQSLRKKIQPFQEINTENSSLMLMTSPRQSSCMKVRTIATLQRICSLN